VSSTERSLTIDHPIGQVWERLADFAAISAWADNVDHSCLLRRSVGSPATGVGAARRVQVGRRALLETVTVWNAPHRLAYGIEGLPPVVKRVQNEWSLTAPHAGEVQYTVVTVTTTVDCGSRPPQLLVAKLLGRRLATDSETMLAGLAAAMKEPSHA
jgi:hypothetical protein